MNKVIAIFLVLSILLSGCSPKEEPIKRVPINELLDIFNNNIELFNTTADILWNHGDFFLHIHEPFGDWRISRYSRTTIDYPDYSLFFTEEEWAVIREAYTLIEPLAFSGRQFYDPIVYAPIIIMDYLVYDESGKKCVYSLIYMRTNDAGTPEQRQSAIDFALNYGSFYSDGPYKLFGYWYYEYYYDDSSHSITQSPANP